MTLRDLFAKRHFLSIWLQEYRGDLAGIVELRKAKDGDIGNAAANRA